MSLTKEHKEFARKVAKRMGGKASASTVRFLFKRHLDVDLTNAEVKALLEDSREPAKQASVAKIAAPRLTVKSNTNLREKCRLLINDAKAEIEKEGVHSVKPGLSSDGITPLLLLSDLHFGEKIEINGVEVFNLDIARDAFNSIIEQAIKTKALDGYDVDEFVVLLGGDIIDGEMIYPAHAFETEGDVFTQMQAATKIIWSGLQRLAQVFPVVRVYCVAGNHGRTSKLHSQMSNWDNALYFTLQMMSSIEKNPRLEIHTPHQMWMDFKVRGWNVHTRHIGVVQAATASPAKKVMMWMKNHNDADLFFFGHYHNPEMYSHGYKRIFKNGALPPANDFAERIGFESSQGQWLVGITDDELVAFSKVIIPDTLGGLNV